MNGEPSSSSSSSKRSTEPKAPRTGFALINDDVLQNILGRLPALTFASAACVSKSWNQTCNRILSRPKLTSALSLNPSLRVKWGDFSDDSDDQDDYLPAKDMNNGIVLTVGSIPGLKVDAIPLSPLAKDLPVAMVDKFVMDIKDYTSSVSGCTSPVGIIMFGENELVDMKPILEALDYTMPMETIIVGDERGHFLYRSADESRDGCGSPKYSDTEVVALIFARDRDKSCGDIEFHVALSNGTSAVGPIHKAVSVRANCSDCTWLTARREGHGEILDGQGILNYINDELENRIESSDLYIGVTKRRKFHIGSEKPRWITSLAFHGVIGGDEEYLFVNGVGIKTGDYFQFYHSDPHTALSSSINVSLNLKKLKIDENSNNCHHMRTVAANKEVFGGLIFSCYGRGESFFGRINVDSSPFVENFPGVPVAGVFCGGEIGRGSSSLIGEGNKESSARCCLHVYSTVYLVMSYTSACPEH